MSSKRQLWLEALRSGEYKQGQSALKQEDENGITYCCLGVACDVVAPERFSAQPRINGKYTFAGKVFDWHSEHEVNLELQGSPSDDVLQLLGISEEDASDLIHMNDGENRDFNEIADYVETLPPR